VDNGYTRAAFADVLKDMVANEYNIPRSHCDDPEFKEAPILTLPVIPKDDFTLMIAKMMYKEFRTEDGRPAMDFHVDPSGAFLGLITSKGFLTEGVRPVQLYWTPRALCILKGSTNRAVDSSYWVGRTIENINSLMDPGTEESDDHKFVISDLRYRSEVEQLRQAFGKDLITVRINRFDECQSTDPSERDLDNYKFDVVIENKSSLEDLYKQLENL
jgi:hypothetical protein